MKQFFTLLYLLIGFSLFAQEDRSMVQSYPAMASKGKFLGNIPPLRDTPPITTYNTASGEDESHEKQNYFFGNEAKNPNPQPEHGDPLVKPLTAADRGSNPQIIPGLNFEGLHDPSGIYPPDPSGDIGKNHYVQMVNSSDNSWFQIWDKVTGNSVYGPALSSTIWSQLGLGSIGDCIVQYDQDAERWLMMELITANQNSPFYTQILIAISNDSDPTGGWKAYSIQTLGFPDYPKLYVWNNAYFLTINELYNGNKCSGYALNRADLLTGEPSIDIYRFEMPTFQGISFQPATGADWEGGPPPPAGSPGYLFRLYDDAWGGGQDHLESWEVNVNWNNVALSHIDGPSLIYPQPFETRVCFGGSFSFDCIEQPGSAPRLEAMETNFMYRAPYRNFGDHESVLLNHVVDVSGVVGNGGDAAVRWYELQKSGNGDWHLAQQGTYAPDLETNRFMGMLSMDEAGNIGLGYTGASKNLFPGLYLTGHRVSDPPGEMTLDEYTLAPGGAAHSHNRWGDYSNMAVDPYDGRTFWFTGEYQPNNSVVWSTRIGTFKVQRDTYDIKPEVLEAPVASSYLGNSEQVKVRIKNGGLAATSNATVTLIFENNVVVTDNISGSIAAGDFLDHTFSQTVAMPTPGKNYKFRIITHWNKDQFSRNDTLDVVVQKLTANDAAIVAKYNLPALVCGTETDFSLVLKNAAGIPMHSATINWRINAQTWKVYNWSGNLAPGERDTIPLHATGIVDGLNGLRAISSLPNGLQDEKINNDTLIVKFYGNSDGTYLTANSTSNSGALHWELRTQANSLLSQGEVSAQQPTAQICSDDNQCYKISLKATAFSWEGHFVLRDIFGKILVEITNATATEQVFTICLPARQQIDFGALELVSPTSMPNLTATEPVSVLFRNFGLTQQSNVNVSYSLNGGVTHTEMLAGPFSPGQTVTHTFAGAEDLSIPNGIYNFKIGATVTGDQNVANDTLSARVVNRYQRELELVNIDGSGACGDSSYAFITLLVKNNGIGNQHSFDVAYTLNGVSQPTIPDNILVALPDETAEVPLYIPNLKNGNNTLVLNIGNVDGFGPDETPANDGGSINFTIDPGSQLLALAFSPGNKPAETSWDIIDNQGNILYSGGPYTAPMSFNLANACLKTDSCYHFRIHDTGGDGMPGGYVSASLGGISVFEYVGENFGSELSIPFCVTSLCADLVLNATVTQASGAGSNDGQIEGLASGGNPPYQYALNGGNLQASPIFKNLTANQYSLECVDAFGCSREILINLGTVGSVEPRTVRKIEVSPNPTIGVAHVALPAYGNESSAFCTVYDTHGKLIQTTLMTRWDNSLHGNIALDRFPSGQYYLRVSGLDQVYTTRVVKK